MGQEAEKEINFEDLKAKVDAAIKNWDISIIEKIEDDKKLKEHQLRYMQKYAESLISKNEFETGNIGIGLAFVAIGLSFIIAVIADSSNKLMSSIEGILFFISGSVIIFWKTPKVKRIEFIHEIIMKIEEKFPQQNLIPETK